MAKVILPARDFYVYVHHRASDGKPFYVGKGRGNRSNQTANRTEKWLGIAIDGYTVSIHKTGLSEQDAFAIECALIKDFGLENLVNVTEGGRLGFKRDEPNSNSSFAKQLYQLKREHGLTNANIADLACVSIKTVESWLADATSANHRKMPERNLVLIKKLIGTK